MDKNVLRQKNKPWDAAGFILSALLAGFALTFKFTEGLPFWAYGRVSLDLIKARIYSGLGDYQFDMIVSSLLCGAAIYFVREKFGKYLRGFILPTTLGFIVVFGRSAAEFGNLSGVFDTFPFIVRGALASLGFGVIFRLLFALFEAGLKKVSSLENGPEFLAGVFDDHIFRNVFWILILLWLPVTILNFPGNYNADFIGQMMQTTGEMPWSGHHPIVLTAVIGVWFKLFKAVFGNYDLGLFIWIILQEIALASALSLTVKELKKRGAKAPLLALVSWVYVLSPIYSNIVTTAIKDVFFIAAVIWYVLLTISFYDDEKKFLEDRKSVCKIILAAFLTCMCRNNGSIIIFVSGLVMSVYALKDFVSKHVIKKAIVLIILPLGIYTALSSGIKAYTGAQSDGLKEMLSIPMQQTALYMTRYEDELTPEEKIEAVAKKIYGADGVIYAPAAKKQLKKIAEMGYGKLPVCMAKTQYSLSDDPSLLGRPTGFELNVRDAYVSAGAGFIVVLTGNIMTMPGLPKKPAAFDIDVDDNGNIVGLF